MHAPEEADRVGEAGTHLHFGGVQIPDGDGDPLPRFRV